MSAKTVIVTGAGQGIGHASLLRQAAAGDHVVAWDIAGAREAAETVIAAGGSAEWAEVDCGEPTAVAEAMVATVERTGSLDGLVHAAGLMRTVRFSDLEEMEYDRLMQVNLRGTMFIVQAYGNAIVERGLTGSAVLLSSGAGRRGRALAPHYAASKAGVISIAQSAALFYGPAIRVNAVCPGVIDTPMVRAIASERHEMIGSPPDDPYPGLQEQIALKRYGKSEDVAKVVDFLLGPLSDYMTGQALNVDGGQEFS